LWDGENQFQNGVFTGDDPPPAAYSVIRKENLPDSLHINLLYFGIIIYTKTLSETNRN
jgi:hypothetical protein